MPLFEDENGNLSMLLYVLMKRYGGQARLPLDEAKHLQVGWRNHVIVTEIQMVL